VICPPFFDLTQAFTEEGRLILTLIQSSLFSGMVLVFCLGVELSDDNVSLGYKISFEKELRATQTVRKPSTWNWPAIISPSDHRGEVIHPMFPRLSQLQRRFSSALPPFINHLRGRRIFPHYTTRGVSGESADYLLHLTRSRMRFCNVIGKRSTLHRRLDPRNVTSRDIVHHYIRTGRWAFGRTQMKQRWYPSGLLPRTYFAWSGTDIAVSCYLRNFFNDLGDIFEPSHRHHRVQPNWLRKRRTDKGFFFYDLTSFTSWYHEHVPFLRALESRFRGVRVLLIGPGLTLRSHDIGDMIASYIDWCNDFPEFCISEGIESGIWSLSDDSYRHLTAGFLGIPGNLVTCTIPHSLALASTQESVHDIQCPGDDLGGRYSDDDHLHDSMRCAATQGTLQLDKVFHTPELCLYLKRLVVELEDSITLSPMLIYPLLPYLISPTSSVSSKQYRLPDRESLFKRTSAVLVSFHRDLWKHSRGVLSSNEKAIIHSFLVMVHRTVGLPDQAVFQGVVQGGDSSEDRYSSVKLKFSIEDPDDLHLNPDSTFSSKYIRTMSVRMVSGVEVTELSCRRYVAGERIIVRSGKVWSFLEDMGYVEILGIPGEVVHLVGADARAAFMSARRPPLREVVFRDVMTADQLIAVGLLSPDGVDESDVSPFFDSNCYSRRYRPYVDLDNPRSSAQTSWRSADWKTDDPYASRDSVSPDPETSIVDLY
jgi:hypothetical protein